MFSLPQIAGAPDLRSSVSYNYIYKRREEKVTHTQCGTAQVGSLHTPPTNRDPEFRTHA
jgi:hypothetical protein